MNHGLDDSIHVASMTEIEKSPSTFSTTRALCRIGGDVGIISVSLTRFAFLGSFRSGRDISIGFFRRLVVYRVLAPGTIHRGRLRTK